MIPYLYYVQHIATHAVIYTCTIFLTVKLISSVLDCADSISGIQDKDASEPQVASSCSSNTLG